MPDRLRRAAAGGPRAARAVRGAEFRWERKLIVQPGGARVARIHLRKWRGRAESISTRRDHCRIPGPGACPAVLVNISYTLPSTLVPILGEETVTSEYAGGVPGTAIDMLRVAVKLPAVLDGAWGASVAVQVGSSQSATTPLYVSASP